MRKVQNNITGGQEYVLKCAKHKTFFNIAHTCHKFEQQRLFSRIEYNLFIMETVESPT
ncbi:hypothetical protein Hanom_Chr01g00094881 [Helianthus anomalus]